MRTAVKNRLKKPTALALPAVRIINGTQRLCEPLCNLALAAACNVLRRVLLTTLKGSMAGAAGTPVTARAGAGGFTMARVARGVYNMGRRSPAPQLPFAAHCLIHCRCHPLRLPCLAVAALS